MKKFKDLCTTAKTKLSKAGYSVMAAAGTLSLMTPMVAADGGDELKTKITDAVDKIKGIVAAIFFPLAIVAFIIAAIFRAVSKNPRTAEEATEWMKRIIITAALAGGAYLLLNWAVGLGGNDISLSTKK